MVDLAAPDGSGRTESALRRVLRRYALSQALREAETLDAEMVSAGA